MSEALLGIQPTLRSTGLPAKRPVGKVLPLVLQMARCKAEREQLGFAGSLTPTDAWMLFSHQQAVLVDIRTLEEYTFVGYIPQALHIPWETGISRTRNPRFVRELEAKTGGKDTVILLICRSGKRSRLAAEVATKAGFNYVFNVLEGFEGDLDEQQHRGNGNGWRHGGLPWVQN